MIDLAVFLLEVVVEAILSVGNGLAALKEAGEALLAVSLHVASHLTSRYTLQTTHGAFKLPLRVAVNILQVSRQFSLSGKGLSADVTWKSRSLTVFLDMSPQTFFCGHRCSTLFNGTNQLWLFRVAV